VAQHNQSAAEIVANIQRLRRIERAADSPVRRELALVRESLEKAVGPTINRAAAARMLGISQTALDRWIDKGEIAAVLTPRGRREIPLSELVDLLDEVDRARSDTGAGRPLAHVVRNRQRQARETIDLDRLLPRPRRRTHRTAELKALAYHRLVAERLDEQLVDETRKRLRHWREDGRIHPRWAEEWDRILAMPVPEIAEAISADTEHARALRQTSPFAGVLTEQERRRLFQAVEDRALA
jgi:hypothetical protein